MVCIIIVLLEKHGVLLPLIDKPSTTRSFALQAAYGTASALDYMHQNSIAHGDVYAHNILAGELGEVTLCDYGASFFYKPEQRAIWEPMEVRSFMITMSGVVPRTGN